jgi:hypothetical protein
MRCGCTQCVEWECGWLGKVPHVWNGNVDGLEGDWSTVGLMIFSIIGG